MKLDLAAALRRATERTRAGNLAEATRLIQETLGRNGAAPTPSEAPDANGSERGETLRKSLGETLALLREGRFKVSGMPAGDGLGAKPGAPPPIPEGARFVSRSFSCAAGSRGYKIYVPASAAERPRGLIVMLHGCTQDPDDFALGTGMNAVAEKEGLAVAYPAQTRADNPQGCWRWFEPAHQERAAGEPAMVAGMAQAIVAEFGIDPSRVFVAGLSAGGAMAAVLGEAYPEVFAAVGVHSGLAAGSARDVASAFAAMRGDAGSAWARSAKSGARTIVFQGLADRTVHPVNADRVMAAAEGDRALTSLASRGRSAGGRAYERTVVAGPDGDLLAECWRVEGLGHAWSGGKNGGSYVDPSGPDASAEMARFFLEGDPVTPSR